MNKEDLILDLLKELRSDIDRRFDETNRRIDELKEEANRRIDEVKEELRDVKHDLRLDSRKLEKVYENREKVKITFGWQWGLVSLFIAITAAGITKIFFM